MKKCVVYRYLKLLKNFLKNMENQIQERWGEATNELIKNLETHNIDFSKLNAIELFGRDGTWQTKIFANKVKTIEIWEINSSWKHKLKKHFPNSIIKIQDSINVIREEENLPKFGLILIDNPMNTFGNTIKNDMYCEHFDVLDNIDKISQSETIVIFNVNRKPFDYVKHPLWNERRNKFYKKTDTSNMELNFLLNFYEEKFNSLGFLTLFKENIVRVLFNGDNMTYYFAYKLKKY